MRHHGHSLGLTLLLGAALLLPLGLAAQNDGGTTGDNSTPGITPDSTRHREFHERAREFLRNQRQDAQQARTAYRQAVEEFGRDSEQARAARRQLERQQRQFQTAQQRFTQRHRRLHQVHRGRNSFRSSGFDNRRGFSSFRRR